ncbi:TIGR03364 family FAD-dependent oxidoreductase [Algoriphagus zhangzhouensis]|uniref:FAD dependent oxidoreductase TIGR03364 n=1 Tax=Algoriphagus zhangzhouensis TaxID=1073327 RepID=A0A1M7ZCD3_9BACT|nr:TIGR03364 family FAD-dependent oxidoreductase [Algoriphagus zhangzhouensis]TDY45547.1 FAD dependent oxidoreductase TIGR03364 [Algoriphagus zhangzhouensis]SHO62537.1 FAD dependent oxidoreductase TIGR03364 [Algoriphagus zhangzhouensis]
MYDLIVVGGGVLGAFHAYHALEAGLKVAILEKDKTPQEATTRNFGQVVPSGMDSKWQTYGRESLKIYKSIQAKFDVTVRNNGSVYLASNPEEQQLIEELFSINQSNGYPSELLSKEACLAKYPGLRSDYVVGGLFFPEEVTVEPKTMIHRLLEYLIREKGLAYFPNHQVISCNNTGNGVWLETAAGHKFKGEKVIICNGRDFKTLYPEIFVESDLEVTKLQMMLTKPQSKSYILPGSILTGLSIRRYEAFHECPSFAEIKSREPKDSLEKKWGVHILFKQATDGSVILGDSHEYADAKDSDNLGYDLNMDIDQFMIDEAKKIIDLPTYEIAHRWFGVYSQCKTKDIFLQTIDENIHVVTGIGGKGMTGSAGFSKEHIEQLFK